MSMKTLYENKELYAMHKFLYLYVQDEEKAGMFAGKDALEVYEMVSEIQELLIKLSEFIENQEYKMCCCREKTQIDHYLVEQLAESIVELARS